MGSETSRSLFFEGMVGGIMDCIKRISRAVYVMSVLFSVGNVLIFFFYFSLTFFFALQCVSKGRYGGLFLCSLLMVCFNLCSL